MARSEVDLPNENITSILYSNGCGFSNSTVLLEGPKIKIPKSVNVLEKYIIIELIVFCKK